MNKKIICIGIVSMFLLASSAALSVVGVNATQIGIPERSSITVNDEGDWDAKVVFNVIATNTSLMSVGKYKVEIESFDKNRYNPNEPFTVDITVKYDIGQDLKEGKKIFADWYFKLFIPDFPSPEEVVYCECHLGSDRDIVWNRGENNKISLYGERSFQIDYDFDNPPNKGFYFIVVIFMDWTEWDWENDEWILNNQRSHMEDPGNLYHKIEKRISLSASSNLANIHSNLLILKFLENFPILSRLLHKLPAVQQ